MKKIQVLLVDDHTIVRNGLRSILENTDEVEVIGEASNGEEALEKIPFLKPQIILVDISMPGISGIELIKRVTKQWTNVRPIILSMHNDDAYILKSVEAGAYGYLLKDSTREEILTALHAVKNGEKYFNASVASVIVNGYLSQVQKVEKATESRKTLLSKKEREVLRLLVEGMSSRQIADQLDLSVRTVDNHRANMMRRLQVHNAAELVKLALEEKLL
ncbi:response regulator [Runella sp.]|uniref:response regulator n=1 Tax=Runella sp. TaxID=1960881 RepID=UPI003D0E972F